MIPGLHGNSGTTVEMKTTSTVKAWQVSSALKRQEYTRDGMRTTTSHERPSVSQVGQPVQKKAKETFAITAASKFETNLYLLTNQS